MWVGPMLEKRIWLSMRSSNKVALLTTHNNDGFGYFLGFGFFFGFVLAVVLLLWSMGVVWWWWATCYMVVVGMYNHQDCCCSTSWQWCWVLVVVEISLMSTIQNPAPPQDLTSTRQWQWYSSKQQEEHDLERQAFSRQEGEQVLAGGLVAVAAAGGKQWQC